MDSFHSMYHLANLNQDHKSNPNSPAVSSKIEAITKSNPLKILGEGTDDLWHRARPDFQRINTINLQIILHNSTSNKTVQFFL